MKRNSKSSINLVTEIKDQEALVFPPLTGESDGEDAWQHAAENGETTERAEQ